MMDFDSEDIARLRVALARISRLVDRQVSSHGLTRSQLSVLGTVARRGPLGISNLADIEGINPTMLSRMIGKLSDQGLVHRLADPEDGRAARIELTKAGSRLHSQIRRERTEVLSARVGELDDQEAGLLLAALPALEQLASVDQPVLAGQARS